jgi:hypothetical protein
VACPRPPGGRRHGRARWTCRPRSDRRSGAGRAGFPPPPPRPAGRAPGRQPRGPPVRCEAWPQRRSASRAFRPSPRPPGFVLEVARYIGTEEGRRHHQRGDPALERDEAQRRDPTLEAPRAHAFLQSPAALRPKGVHARVQDGPKAPAVGHVSRPRIEQAMSPPVPPGPRPITRPGVVRWRVMQGLARARAMRRRTTQGRDGAPLSISATTPGRAWQGPRLPGPGASWQGCGPSGRADPFIPPGTTGIAAKVARP